MQIINKKKSLNQFYIGNREFLRDKRLSADAKNIYVVLNSLAETCENVCPGYFWIANEIGYDTEGKEERAVFKWVKSKIDELIKLSLINQINKDRGYDYEILDYIPTEQKSTVTLNKKVQSPLNKKVQLEIREEKEDISTLSNSKPEKTFLEILESKINDIKANPFYPILIEKAQKKNIAEEDLENELKLAMNSKAEKGNQTSDFTYFQSWVENLKTRFKQANYPPNQKKNSNLGDFSTMQNTYEKFKNEPGVVVWN